MLRSILLAHRWLGIIVGLIMTIWCLSGFVMMYSPYPRLDADEQLRGLPALDLPADMRWQHSGLPDDLPIAGARVERMGDRLVLRVVPEAPPARAIAQMRATPASIDLATGNLVELSAAEALEVGHLFGARVRYRRTGADGDPGRDRPVDRPDCEASPAALPHRLFGRRHRLYRRIGRNGAADDPRRTLLGLARRGATLALSDAAAPERRALDPHGDLVVARGLFPHRDRHVDRHRPPPPQSGRPDRLPLSRPVVVAPCCGTVLRRVDADLGGKRPALHEPVGRPRQPSRPRRARTAGEADGLGRGTPRARAPARPPRRHCADPDRAARRRRLSGSDHQ
jgi:hypothetical protein